MRTMAFHALAATGLALLVATPAAAAIIPGLFNTGTDASNAALAGGNFVADPHYSIVGSGPAYTFYGADVWIPDDANSKWITCSANGAGCGGVRTYRTTFDLTGFDPETVQISGLWAVDNDAQLWLNGAFTGFGIPNGFFSFRTYFGFTLNSAAYDFLPGINTLDFIVTGRGGPEGLRVDELSGTATQVSTPIPEPAAWAMMIAGLGLVGALRRARRRPALLQAA